MLIDTHCHLDAREFDTDREAVIAAAHQAGVNTIVIPAVDVHNFTTVRDLAHKHEGLFYALGIHPLCVPNATEQDLQQLEHCLQTAVGDLRCVAIGEIGLDFFVPELKTEAMQAKQVYFYEQQLKLAKQFDLPVLLHVRRSVDMVTKYLRRHEGVTGIAHAFNGSMQQAEILIQLGFKLGFGGTLTFNAAKNIRRLATELPIEAIVLETDAPDIAPSWLGVQSEAQRNQPAELSGIAQCLADLRDLEKSELARLTTRNAQAILPRLVEANPA